MNCQQQAGPQLRVLFVDDEPNVLEGLRRMLRASRGQWEMEFAGGGAEAIGLLESRPFDVVVSDMRMPGMDGAQLLDEVKRRWPAAVRMILSGEASHSTVLKCVQATHQFLPKPCEPALLRATISRTHALRAVLDNPTLQRAVAQIAALPSPPAIYTELVQELQASEPSMQRVADIISRDLGMTSKILQLVNSAFFGLGHLVSTPVQAAVLLGIDTLQSLVLSLQLFSQIEGAGLQRFGLQQLSDHSLRVASKARAIAACEKADRGTIDRSFLAGMLHDIGKLVLAVNLSEQYAEACGRAEADGVAIHEAEREVLGVCHAEVGAYLLGLWGLPDAIVEAVAFHHEPLRSGADAFSPLTAVHVANALDIASSGRDQTPELLLSAGYLEQIGCSSSLPSWQAACETVQE